jgi:glycosyltransferase involved in cell wall biosynthesis
MPEKYPLVTVPVLVYNNAEYIKGAIDSVLMQNYPNIELIISDDASASFPISEIEGYLEKKRENIKKAVIRQNPRNLGTVKHFNTILSQAEGKYFVSLAGDDQLADSRVITDVVAMFEKEKCLVITGLRDVYDETMTTYETTLPGADDIVYLEKSSLELFRRLSKQNFISGACSPFSRALIEKYGYFNEDYLLIEDYPAYLQLARNNERIAFINRVLIRYRNNGVSKEPGTVYQKDYLKVMKQEILKYRSLFTNEEYGQLRMKYYKLSHSLYSSLKKKTAIFRLKLFHIDMLIGMRLKDLGTKKKHKPKAGEPAS